MKTNSVDKSRIHVYSVHKIWCEMTIRKLHRLIVNLWQGVLVLLRLRRRRTWHWPWYPIVTSKKEWEKVFIQLYYELSKGGCQDFIETGTYADDRISYLEFNHEPVLLAIIDADEINLCGKINEK